ncbi:hypothetical protein AcW1_009303 [Taiwanofungus camphoratus]|nr:hypothetical protein AcW1_009303 [Antrodia cinnamomea]
MSIDSREPNNARQIPAASGNSESGGYDSPAIQRGADAFLRLVEKEKKLVYDALIREQLSLQKEFSDYRDYAAAALTAAEERHLALEKEHDAMMAEKDSRIAQLVAQNSLLEAEVTNLRLQVYTSDQNDGDLLPLSVGDSPAVTNDKGMDHNTDNRYLDYVDVDIPSYGLPSAAQFQDDSPFLHPFEDLLHGTSPSTPPVMRTSTPPTLSGVTLVDRCSSPCVTPTLPKVVKPSSMSRSAQNQTSHPSATERMLVVRSPAIGYHKGKGYNPRVSPVNDEEAGVIVRVPSLPDSEA